MRVLAAGCKLRVLIADGPLRGDPTSPSSTSPRTTSISAVHPLAHSASSSTDFAGTVLIVSHDRHFLNSVATHVADVDFGHHHHLHWQLCACRLRSPGQVREGRSSASRPIAQSAKKKIGELEDFVRRFGSHASKSKQAQSRLKQIEKPRGDRRDQGRQAVEPRAALRALRRWRSRSGRDVLRVEGVRKAFDKKVVIDGAGLNVEPGRPHRRSSASGGGIGESTLLAMIVGAYKGLRRGDEGVRALPRRRRAALQSHDASVGYFAQDHHEPARPLHPQGGRPRTTGFIASTPGERRKRSAASWAGCSSAAQAALKPTEALSGGEAARLLARQDCPPESTTSWCSSRACSSTRSTSGAPSRLLEGLPQGPCSFVSFTTSHFVARLATRIVELKDRAASDTRYQVASLVDFGGRTTSTWTRTGGRETRYEVREESREDKEGKRSLRGRPGRPTPPDLLPASCFLPLFSGLRPYAWDS